MAIFGWLVICVIMFKLSIVAGLVLFNCAGKWNIGGVSNSLATQAGAWLFAGIVALGWYEVYVMSPFEIMVK